jgi:hypothetical protein
MLETDRRPTYPTESTWSLLQGENDGAPMIVLRNDSAKRLSAHPDYRHRVGIAFPLREPDENGFAGQREAEELDAIEEELQQRLEVNHLSLQVLGIASSGMRELVFYTRDPSSAEAVIDSVRAGVRSHEVRTTVEEDPDWKLYASFG